MTISSTFSAGSYASDLARSLFGTSRAQLDDLQRQLSSGQIATTYGGLGANRYTALNAQAKIAAFNTYNDSIDQATIRLNEASTQLSSLYTNLNTTRSTLLTTTYTVGSSGLTIPQTTAQAFLSEAVDGLNTDVNGQYLFGGRVTDTKPVVDTKTLLYGDGTRAGVSQLIQEQKTADGSLIPGGTGRTTVSINTPGPGDTVTLQDNSPTQTKFGFQIPPAPAGTPVSTLSNATVTGPAGGAISVQFTGVPTPGQTITISLSTPAPDSKVTQITLTARAQFSGAQPDTFAVGPDGPTTAANFQAALTASVQKAAQTDLNAYSATKAANDFFNQSPTAPIQRIVPPLVTATTTAPDTTNANTVKWYNGDTTIYLDGAGNPTTAALRASQTVRADDQINVGTAVRADEQPIRTTLAQFAVLSLETFDPNNVNDTARYQALAQRVQASLTPPAGSSVQDIVVDVGLATTSLSNAKSRNKTAANVLDTTLSGIENADDTQISAEILSLQNKLQASYQVTNIVSKLNLADYLK